MSMLVLTNNLFTSYQTWKLCQCGSISVSFWAAIVPNDCLASSISGTSNSKLVEAKRCSASSPSGAVTGRRWWMRTKSSDKKLILTDRWMCFIAYRVDEMYTNQYMVFDNFFNLFLFLTFYGKLSFPCSLRAISTDVKIHIYLIK